MPASRGSGQGASCPPGPLPDQPASRAAKAAIPAEPRCQDGSARSPSERTGAVLGHALKGAARYGE
jgi:hypothetical protein